MTQPKRELSGGRSALVARDGETVRRANMVSFRQSAEGMGLKKGDAVTPVVKATEVMIAKP